MDRKAKSCSFVNVCTRCICVMSAPLKCLRSDLAELRPRNLDFDCKESNKKARFYFCNPRVMGSVHY